MKILILQDDFPPESFGGAGVVAFNFALGLRKKGHDISVITAINEKSQEGESNYERLKIFKIYSHYNERWRAYLSLYNPQTIKKIKRIINELKPDIVYAHNIHYHLSYYCLKIAKESGAKVFLTIHDVMPFHYGKFTEFINLDNFSVVSQFDYRVSILGQIKKFKRRFNPFRNIIIRHYLKYADKIFAVSNALVSALSDNKIKGVLVLHTGIDVDNWEIDDVLAENFKEKYNIQNNKIVLFGGRLSDSKGAEKIIFSMKQIIGKIPNAVLVVIGNGGHYKEKMLRIIRELNMMKNVIFTGWISGNDLKSAYFASNVVVVPSICFDSFPVVNLEAMASKKPVVGTCFGGTPEIVEEGVTGYIINPLNVDFMAEKIADLLENPQMAEEFGEKGYNKIKNHFNLNNYLDEYLNYL